MLSALLGSTLYATILLDTAPNVWKGMAYHDGAVWVLLLVLEDDLMPRFSDDTWSLRQQVLRKYGGKCMCACGCGDTNLRHLQLDHVMNNGGAERLTIRGKHAYVKLLAQPRNPNLNPLCANCHFQKTMFETCDGGFTPTPTRDEGLTDTAGQEKKDELRHRREVIDLDLLQPRQRKTGAVAEASATDNWESQYPIPTGPRKFAPLPVPPLSFWSRLKGFVLG